MFLVFYINLFIWKNKTSSVIFQSFHNPCEENENLKNGCYPDLNLVKLICTH